MDYSPASRLFYISALSDKQINDLYELASKAYPVDFTKEIMLEDTVKRMNMLSRDSKFFLVLSLEDVFDKDIFDNNLRDLRVIDSVKNSDDFVVKKFLLSEKGRTSLKEHYNQNCNQFTGLGIVQVLKLLYDVDHYEPSDGLVVNPFFRECLDYLKGGFDEFADKIIEKGEGMRKTKKIKNMSKETPLGAKFRNIYDVFFYGSFEYEGKDLPLDELLGNAKNILSQDDVCGSYSFEDFEADLDKIPDENIADFVERHKYLIGTIYRKTMANQVQERPDFEEFPAKDGLITALKDSVNKNPTIKLDLS